MDVVDRQLLLMVDAVERMAMLIRPAMVTMRMLVVRMVARPMVANG